MLVDDAQTRLLRLELEIKRLGAENESLKNEAENQSSEKILELEKENKRLSHKVRRFIDVTLFYVGFLL